MRLLTAGGIVDRIIDDVELVVAAGGRELRKHALTHLLQVFAFRIFNNVVLLEYLLIKNGPQPVFLLLVKDVWLIHYLGE